MPKTRMPSAPKILANSPHMLHHTPAKIPRRPLFLAGTFPVRAEVSSGTLYVHRPLGGKRGVSVRHPEAPTGLELKYECRQV